MPVSLTEASRGAQTDLDTAVIDEFRARLHRGAPRRR